MIRRKVDKNHARCVHKERKVFFCSPLEPEFPSRCRCKSLAISKGVEGEKVTFSRSYKNLSIFSPLLKHVFHSISSVWNTAS